MPELHVTSAANPRLKAVAALRRRRERDRTGMCVVEGFEELSLAVAAGVVPALVLHCAELMADPAAQAALLDRCRALGSDTLSVGRQAFERTAYREGPDGFLAVVPSPGMPLATLTVPRGSLVLVCEAVEKPGNLGAMLRSADAAGVAAVVAADPVSDWANPNVIRASKGTVFSVPVATGTLDEVLGWLARTGMRLIATTPDTDTRHTDADLTGAVAVAVGAEKHGLTVAALRAADTRVRIPMAGRADSLNVATSAAVVLYEAVRQRDSHG